MLACPSEAGKPAGRNEIPFIQPLGETPQKNDRIEKNNIDILYSYSISMYWTKFRHL